MKNLILILSVYTIALCSNFAVARPNQEIIVIANIQGQPLQLSKSQVRSLFMGGAIGHDLHVVTLPPSSISRVRFNTKVIGLTEDRIQSYWAQMRFSGRRAPPKEMPDEQALLRYLLANPGSVGYITANATIPENLVVIYRTGL